jgi:hypothetical protein
MAHKISQEMRECISTCQECSAVCMETMSHCLALGGKHAEARHIGLLADCAEICRTSAAFMLHGSELHTRTCSVCAEVCRACAENCGQMAGDDELMKRCADMCRRCAESCERMSGTATRRAG